MLFPTAVIAVVVLVIAGIAGVVLMLRGRRRRMIEQHLIAPEDLLALLRPDPKVLLVDVRQPLDLLAHSEMIPGAKRIPPRELLANPSLLPAEMDAVIYCTCENQKTSLEVVEHGLSLGFRRVKVLRGGLSEWKAKGYPVIPYTESFRLDTAG